jgi:hypothetical protein
MIVPATGWGADGGWALGRRSRGSSSRGRRPRQSAAKRRAPPAPSRAGRSDRRAAHRGWALRVWGEERGRPPTRASRRRTASQPTCARLSRGPDVAERIHRLGPCSKAASRVGRRMPAWTRIGSWPLAGSRSIVAKPRPSEPSTSSSLRSWAATTPSARSRRAYATMRSASRSGAGRGTRPVTRAVASAPRAPPDRPTDHPAGRTAVVSSIPASPRAPGRPDGVEVVRPRTLAARRQARVLPPSATGPSAGIPAPPSSHASVAECGIGGPYEPESVGQRAGVLEAQRWRRAPSAGGEGVGQPRP